MLEHIVVGWEEIEPIFLVNIALSRPFILLGKHGTCKTTCAKQIAKIYSNKSYRFYDATKDDLISIAGIPIPQKLAQGKLEFSRHDRSIWDAKVIVIDELTRANRENQNLWLEILEEKSCFGKKLHYKALIATMNPESYAATFKLDEALLDRFYAVIPIPDLQKGTTSKIFKQVIQLNNGNQNLCSDKVRTLVRNIQKTFSVLNNNKTIRNVVSEYVSSYIEILLGKTDEYISPRKTIHLVEEILGLAAYYKIHCKQDFLVKAAETALMYVLGVPFKIKTEVLMQIHSNLKDLLLDKTMNETDRIRIELTKLSTNDNCIKYAKKNIERLVKHLPFDEVNKFLSQIIDKAGIKDLPVLRDLLSSIKGHEEQKRAIQGRMLFYELQVVDKIQSQLTRYEIRNEEDFKAFNRMRSFTQRLKKLPFDPTIEKLVFKEEIDYRQILKYIRKGENHAVPSKTDSGV